MTPKRLRELQMHTLNCSSAGDNHHRYMKELLAHITTLEALAEKVGEFLRCRERLRLLAETDRYGEKEFIDAEKALKESGDALCAAYAAYAQGRGR